MYWSDWGNHPKIETAAMDGTLRETLVQDNIQWPTGLWRQRTGRARGRFAKVAQKRGRGQLTRWQAVRKLFHKSDGWWFREQGGAAPGGDSASPQPEREAGASPRPVPPGLAVDYHNERLYWADAKLSVIGSIRLNGTDPIVAADSKRGECLTAALAARPRASILSAEPTASPGPAVLPGLAPHNPAGPSLHQPCRPKARR